MEDVVKATRELAEQIREMKLKMDNMQVAITDRDTEINNLQLQLGEERQRVRVMATIDSLAYAHAE